MKKRQIIIWMSLVLITAFGWFGMKALSNMKPETEEKEKKEIKRFVKAEQVKYKTVETNLSVTGRVSSQHFIDLSSEVQGKILSGNVKLKKGESFRKGQLLIRIYNTEAVLALQAHKSRFLNLVANLLPDFKIDFPDSYKTWLDFFEKIDINKNIPEFPEIKSNKEKIYLAGRNVLSEYYSIKSEEIRLSKYYIYAPFNGTFSDVYAEIGAITGMGGKIAKMIRTDKHELEAPVEVSDVKFIKAGHEVKLISADSKHIYKGTVVRISNFVDPKTQSVSVFVAITPNSKSSIYQGEYLRAEFSQIKVSSAMEIPRKAVFNHNEVFIVENGKLVKRTINILKKNEQTIIFNGLNEGDLVVNESLINAVENSDVEILK